MIKGVWSRVPLELLFESETMNPWCPCFAGAMERSPGFSDWQLTVGNLIPATLIMNEEVYSVL